MSFDDDPKDQDENHQCPNCEGSVVKSKVTGLWECDNCNWDQDWWLKQKQPETK